MKRATFALAGALLVGSAGTPASASDSGTYVLIDVPELWTTPKLALRRGSGTSRTYKLCDGTVVPWHERRIADEVKTTQRCTHANASSGHASSGGLLATVINYRIPVRFPHVAAAGPPPDPGVPAAAVSPEPTPTAVSTPTPTRIVRIRVLQPRVLEVGTAAIPVETCGTSYQPRLSCLVGEPRGPSASASLQPSEVDLIAFGVWRDSTWTFTQLLNQLHGSAVLDPSGSVTITVGSRSVKQPLTILEGLGYAFPLVSTLGKLGATVSMTQERVVIAY
jgi:hypothetical protein